MFQDKVIVITGGAGGIGKCIGEEFQKQGAHVCIIDSAEGPHYVGDIAGKATLEVSQTGASHPRGLSNRCKLPQRSLRQRSLRHKLPQRSLKQVQTTPEVP